MQSNNSDGLIPGVEVLFQDKNVLVINKPAGIAMHAKNLNDSSTTIKSIFSGQLSKEGDPLRSGIVHRLDKDTSGVVIMAKNEPTLKFLQKQFSSRTVDKQYNALVWGHLKHQHARIELPIRRSIKAPNIMSIQHNGKMAVSEYRVEQRYLDCSLLSIKLHTGRTHQIRVQFAHIGHPVVGDKLYGHKPVPKGLTRQFLHAYRLSIVLPGNIKPSTYEAPLPIGLKNFLEGLNE